MSRRDIFRRRKRQDQLLKHLVGPRNFGQLLSSEKMRVRSRDSLHLDNLPKIESRSTTGIRRNVSVLDRRSQKEHARVQEIGFSPVVSTVPDLPKEHPICVERRQRRQILFALGRAGSGIRNRRPEKLDDIDVICRK